MTHNIIFRIIHDTRHNLQDNTVEYGEEEEGGGTGGGGRREGGEEEEEEEEEEKEGGGGGGEEGRRRRRSMRRRKEEEETMQAATDLSEELFQEQAGPFRVEIPVLGRVTDVGTVQH